MTQTPLATVILAAGKGTRMKSDLSKVLHPLAGRPMINHLLATLDGLQPEKQVVVVGRDMDALCRAVAPARTAVQDPPMGTGHAVMAAREELDGFEGDVLVLFGDSPLVSRETLDAMLAARRANSDPAVVVLGFRPDDTAEYARLITDNDGGLEAIVEHKDASDDQRAITLCNSGFMAIDGKRLFALLDEVGTDNAKGEYYLTDIVAIARRKGWTCAWVEGPLDDVLGINSRAQLAEAEAVVQQRLRAAAMDGGVTMLDPSTVTLSFDTRFGRDVVIEPNVFFGPGVDVADRVTIKGFSHIEGASVGADAVVGPFARLRPGAELQAKAKVGNFVEAKNTVIEEGAKVNHLTYVGDSRIGAGANVGAGTITCNYDGFGKHRTDIGAGAFIGSNSTLVAPVTIGDGALVAAGSVVIRDVSGDAVALGRADQSERAGAAARFRQRKLAEKQKKSA